MIQLRRIEILKRLVRAAAEIRTIVVHISTRCHLATIRNISFQRHEIASATTARLVIQLRRLRILQHSVCSASEFPAVRICKFARRHLASVRNVPG
jgi:hypothetical protein